MEIPDAIVNELFLNPELKKSDTRTVIFLLQRPGALSADELAAGVGVSKRAVTKSVNRLIGAGLIQPGEYQAKRRTLNIPETVIIEPREATEESNKNRFDRLESMIGTLMDTLGAVLNPAPLHDGQNKTGIMPVCVQVEEQKNTQPGMIPESGQKETDLNPAHIPDVKNTTQTGHIQATMIPTPVTCGIEQATKGTQAMMFSAHAEPSADIHAIMSPESDSERTKPLSVITEQGTNGTPKDTINDDLDTALIRARGLLAAKQALLLKEKQKQPGAPASIDDEFHALFGVQLPSGSDPAAVGVMIARRKSGKLDNVKSPLAYLASLAGKVAPTLATPAKLPPVPMINQPLLVTETSLDDYEQRRKIKAAWFGLNDEQRMPFHELREKKALSGIPGRAVPVELLAFQQFTQECLAGRVKI